MWWLHHIHRANWWSGSRFCTRGPGWSVWDRVLWPSARIWKELSHHLQLPLVSLSATVSGTARLEKIPYVHLFTYFTPWRLTRFIFCFSPECLFTNNVLVTRLITCVTPGVNIYQANKCISLKSPTSTCPSLTAFVQKLHFSSNARMIPVDR